MSEPRKNRIAELLLREDMGLEDAALLCDVRPRTVERWIREDTAIPDEHKQTLTTRFAVTTDYMLGWDRDSAETPA